MTDNGTGRCDLDLLARHLQKARVASDKSKLTSCCPFHGETMPSFCVWENGGYKCAGCQAAGHFPTLYKHLGIECEERDNRAARKASIVYEYLDKDGRCVAKVERIDKDEGKTFVQHSLRDGRWEKKKHYPFPFYHLDRLAAAPAGQVVWITEGEKCADAICSVGQLATTASGGSTGLKDVDLASFQHLRGKRCIILPDNDDPGEACAAAWYRELRKRGIDACIVRIPGLPKKGDVYDYLATGGSLDTLVAIATERSAMSREQAKLARTLRELAEQLETGNGDTVGIKRDALLSIAGSESYKDAERNTSLRQELGNLAEEIKAGITATRLYFGLLGLDGITHGVRPGRLVVLGGAPGQGKTAFIWQLVEHVAQHYGPVYISSQEMSGVELAERTAVRHLRRPLEEIAFAEVVALVDRVPEDIEISAKGVTIDWLVADLRLWHAMQKRKPAAAVIDYLQILGRTDKKQDDRAFIADVTRTLKLLARELDINIFLLSQLNRDGRDKDEPAMSCFAGSSSNENDSDVAFVLWYDSRAYVLKNRGGELGSAGYVFDKPFMTFSDAMPDAIDSLEPGMQWMEL